ncbi:hypothetical protein CARUB_v10020457mg [Capsella rubella]|uniref:Uncharacterized protein n=1 Tax=Capsella rubella TaxID=81985 RepID=R0GHD8_9BRAS|nr:probable transcription factor At1g61730 [Capsella rubella]EOA35287.1 hypothetical protein CARUB_v10020457mg [Capsella rubella]
MTKKLNPLEDPPTASSSEDEDVETSEAGEASDDSSSSEEDESSKIPIKSLASKSTAAAAVAAPSKPATAADSDSGSETETDSDSESTNPPNSGSGKTISVNLKKKEDSTSYAALALPAVKSGAKRPASEAAASAKRVKVVTSGGGGEEESVKKPAFQRLWTEDDEIAVLQGMIDFKADTGKSPYEDTNAFYDFIKKSISFEVSKNQFMDKIRSLRKKYTAKGKTGVEPSFSKAHDQKSYELSKFIWGPDGFALESNIKSNGVSRKSQSKSKKKIDSVKQELVFAGSSPNGKKVEDGDDEDVIVRGGDSRKPDWFVNSALFRMITTLGVDEYTLKYKWSLVPDETKKIVEGKFKKLQDMELDFLLEKADLLHDLTAMIIEASKK